MVDRKKIEKKFLAHNFKNFKWIDPKNIVTYTQRREMLGRGEFDEH